MQHSQAQSAVRRMLRDPRTISGRTAARHDGPGAAVSSSPWSNSLTSNRSRRRLLSALVMVPAAVGLGADAIAQTQDGDDSGQQQGQQQQGQQQQGQQQQGQQQQGQQQQGQMSPEEKYARRFPQRVQVSDVIGKPLHDQSGALIGRVRDVAEIPDGKIALIVPYGGLLGIGARPVALPIELVASIGKRLLALEMSRQKLASAPTWQKTDGRIMRPDETVRVAVTKR